MALTNAQFRDHVGRMFIQGMASILANGDDINLKAIMLWIKAHKNDSSFSNEADRTEAMVRMFREIFLRTNGRSSDDTMVNRRIFRKWIDGMFTYGEGIIIEPLGQ